MGFILGVAVGGTALAETAAEIRERQKQNRERIEQRMEQSRTESKNRRAAAPCPLPDEMKGMTAAAHCKAKNYKDQYGQPANEPVCLRLAGEQKDSVGLFLLRYERLGCDDPEGCSRIACDKLYKDSGQARPAG